MSRTINELVLVYRKKKTVEYLFKFTWKCHRTVFWDSF